MKSLLCRFFIFIPLLSLATVALNAQAPEPLPKAVIDGTGPGWFAMRQEHFTKVNCDPETWTWTHALFGARASPSASLAAR